MQQERADKICRAIYKDFDTYYRQSGIYVDGKDLGYRILYGPPVINPSAMFVGYQPGGDEKDAVLGEQAGERLHWPAQNDYAQAKWKLADRIRRIFRKELVQNSTGTNINFFRAPSISAWNKVPLPERRTAEKQCRGLVSNIIEAIQPENIFIIGLGSFDRIAEGEIVLRLGNRTLVKAGIFSGVPAYGIMHLSGARDSNNDLLAMKNFFEEQS